MTRVDARGLLCPEPVVRVQRAIKDRPETLEAMVDTVAAKENIIRFANAHAYQVAAMQDGSDWVLLLTRK